MTPRGAGNVSTFLKDSEGRLWAGHSEGLLIFRPESATRGRQPWRVVERAGKVEEEDRLALPDKPGEAYHYTADDGLTDRNVTGLYQGSDGHIWIATWGGLTEFVSDHFRRYSTAQGLSEGHLTSVVEDRDGNIWVGTRTRGATKLARNGLVTFRQEDGLSGTHISRIFTDRDKHLCVLTADAFINVYDGQRFAAIRPNLPAEITLLNDALQDREGDWWVATARGLYRFPRSASPAQLARAKP